MSTRLFTQAAFRLTTLRLRRWVPVVAAVLAAGCAGGDDGPDPNAAKPNGASRSSAESDRSDSNSPGPSRRPRAGDEQRSTIAGRKSEGRSAFPGRASNRRPRKTVVQTASDEGRASNAPPLRRESERPAPPVYRPSDDRPQHDDARLAKLGIHKYESKRLKLYTDIDPKAARILPPLIDRAYPAWVKYFGELPPNREKTRFQVTGYVMAHPDRFQRAGLIPADLPKFDNGRHRGYEFWMYEPRWSYWRRHLAIHEATHCFMYSVRDLRFPNWYMEGMAEFFGTHAFDEKGRPHFGVMPQRLKDFVGFARIEYVQQECRAGRPLSIHDVAHIKPTDFLHDQAYAWSWALCKFLDSHPRYGKRFRELGRLHDALQFRQQFARFIRSQSPHIDCEWHLFARGLVYGYDPLRAAIDVRPGKPLAAGQSTGKFALRADRGWQSSGVWVDAGDAVEVAAAGRFELAQKPKPWVCEPQGITITYFQGRPLGEVEAVIVPDSKKSGPTNVRMLPMVPVGRKRRFQAAIKGTIYLRVNDSFAWLDDNRGTVSIRVRRVPNE